MSRRDEQSDIYRRPRRDRNYDDELEVDITRERYPERRAETIVKERESVVTRGPRQPDFLREDYGKTTAGQLVVREDVREEEIYRRSPAPRSRAPPPERVEKIVIEERERERAPPYPRSSRSDVGEREEVIYRERTRSRPPPREPPREEREEIDITIREREREKSRPPPPRSEAPVEEIRFRRGGGPPRAVERTEVEIRESRSPAPAPRPSRTVVERDEIDIREVRSPPSRGRDTFKEEIRIRESSAPAPRRRSPSQGALVARKEEEWVVRRPRRSPPRDYEKEEIIIRRREKTPDPEPESSSSESEPEPEPEPSPPPPPEPKYLPPIIQEIITHHRHIDHPIERARVEEEERVEKEERKEKKKEKKEKKEEHLELEIRRKGTRNGKAYEEDFTFEKDWYEPSEDDSKSTKRSQSIGARSRATSLAPVRRRYEDEYEDEIAAEADYYNSKIASRAYPGEAYNGATKDWALVDVPPGTERVRMDGVGGGRQEITWQRYNGERRGRFVSGDRAFEAEFGNGYVPSPPPQPQLPPAPAPPEPAREIKEEIKITKTTRGEEQAPPRKRDKMWTEVTKDLVIKEAIDEQGYEYEETASHFYIIEYLRYVSSLVEK